MKRIFTVFVMIAVVGTVVVSSCKKKPKPLSEIIGRVWSAQLIKHGSSVVYTKGAATNPTPGYLNFRLDLSSPTSATLKEFDGNTFTGQWEVQETTAGNTLILKNLTPQPTGTNGTIQFTINSATEIEFVMTRTSGSQKTGGTINNYTLVSP